jgi:glycosyl transferase family 25
MLFDNIPVIYINLNERTDRNEHMKKELNKIGVTNAIRFPGVKLDNGALGCSMSHLKCVELAKKNNYDQVFICEDDIEFLDPTLFLNQLQTFLDSNINWDVIIVSGNNMIPYVPVSDCCIKVMNCQTTTGYIVRKEYYDKLYNNFKTGIQKLMSDPSNNSYKIDKYWFSLQRQDNWYLIIPLSVVQKEDYSDIEKKVTNFKKYMLDYNKAYKK